MKTKCERCAKPSEDESRYCLKHSQTPTKQTPRQRKPYHIYSKERWQKLRVSALLSNPLCMCCQFHGYIVPAEDIDHILPIRDRPDLQWMKSNLQPLCHSCHSRKTGLESKGMIYDYKSGYVRDSHGTNIQRITRK